MYVLLIVVCPFVLFLLAIVLCVLLRYTDSDCAFGISKLFLNSTTIRYRTHQCCNLGRMFNLLLFLSGVHVEYFSLYLFTHTGVQEYFHIRWCLWRLIVLRRVSLEEHQLLTLSEHLRSPPFLMGFVSLIICSFLCIIFVIHCLFFSTFPYGHCIVCSSSNYDLW